MAAKKQDTAQAVFLVNGDDDYLIDQHARALVDQLCPKEEQALGLEIIETPGTTIEETASTIARCLEAVQTVGFFGGRKVVWFRNAPLFADAVKSDDVKARLESLAGLLKKGLPEGHVLVISAVRMDGRTAFSKVCKDVATVTEFKTPEKAREADQAVMDRAATLWKEAGLRPAHPAVLEYFVARAGTDTRQLRQETDKLVAYLGAGHSSVTEEDVSAVVSASRESIAWDLADRVGERMMSEALQTVRQLLFQGESAIGLIFGLENRFRELLLLRECMRRKWLRVEGSDRYKKAVWDVPAEGDAILKQFPKDPRKIHPFRTVKLIEQAMKYSLIELLDAQQQLADAHEQMVSSSVPTDVGLELLLIRLIAREEPVGA